MTPEVLSDDDKEEAREEEVEDNKMNERRAEEETVPDEVYLFILAVKPRTLRKVNLITILAITPWREDQEV